MENDDKCYVCGSTNIPVQHHSDPVSCFYDCPVCGRYEFYPVFSELESFDMNKLSSYLLYNGYKYSTEEYRYFTTMSKEKCDEYKKEFNQGKIEHGHPVRLEKENVENWYPKTFAEKVDNILLYFNSCFTHVGEFGTLADEELTSCLFVDRYDYKNGVKISRPPQQINDQKIYMMNFLHNEKYIIFMDREQNKKDYLDGRREPFALSPDGYARIDMLQNY